jgi:hypothetical protein
MILHSQLWPLPEASSTEETPYKLPVLGSPEVGPGPGYFAYVSLSLFLVSDVNMLWFVVLTALAASGHLAYDALCFVSFLFPLAGPPLQGDPEKIFSPGTEPALGGPGGKAGFNCSIFRIANFRRNRWTWNV